MPLGISGVGGIEIFGLITRFGDGQGLPSPVDGGVRSAEPGESEDDVFSSTAHDVEEMLFGDPFNVGIEGAGIAYCTSLVRGLIYVANGDGGGEFLSGESVFPDKLPVDARDISTGINQCGGVDDFKGMRGGDQLNRDTHRFIRS